MPEMAQAERIVSLYETMARISAKMLAAARIEDWDSLVTLEAKSAAQVTLLQRDEPQAALSAEQNAQKAALIAQMLSDDGETRELTTARMTQLSQQMHSASTERKLSRAYGA